MLLPVAHSCQYPSFSLFVLPLLLPSWVVVFEKILKYFRHDFLTRFFCIHNYYSAMLQTRWFYTLLSSYRPHCSANQLSALLLNCSSLKWLSDKLQKFFFEPWGQDKNIVRNLASQFRLR